MSIQQEKAKQKYSLRLDWRGSEEAEAVEIEWKQKIILTPSK